MSNLKAARDVAKAQAEEAYDEAIAQARTAWDEAFASQGVNGNERG